MGLSAAELDALYAARRAARKAGSSGVEMLALPLALDVGELSLRNIRLRTVDAMGNTLSEVQLKRFSAQGVNTAGRGTRLQLLLSIPQGTDEAPLEIAADREKLETQSVLVPVFDDVSVLLEGEQVPMRRAPCHLDLVADSFER